MHNKILIIVIFILSLIIIKKTQKHDEKPNISWINSLNNQNKNIKKIKSDLVLKSFILEKKGFVCYEKKDYFKFFIPNNLEVGSNKEIIWFWSRDFYPKNIFFCDKNKIQNSRLKKIFYPNNIICFLCVQELSTNDLSFYNDSIIIKEYEENIEKITVIKNSKINEYFFYENNILILNIKIISYQNIKNFILPKEIIINWVLEELSVNLLLENIQINNFEFIDWQMPNSKTKINLSNY